MAIESLPKEIGTPCPNFALPSVDNRRYALEDFEKSEALLVMFICNHCPYVKAIEDRLLALAHSYSLDKLQTVAICSNDPSDYPDDRPEALLLRWQQKNYGFPYLIDASQEVAKQFDAACTPDLYLFDGQRKLYYHGRLDDSWKTAELVAKEDLKDAIESLLNHQPPPAQQQPTIGCSIKWKKV